MIKLNCVTCKKEYEKPKEYKDLAIVNVFYKWNVTYCDNCRKEKENKIIKENLPTFIKNLSKKLDH